MHQSEHSKKWDLSKKHQFKVSYIVKKNERTKSDKLIWGLLTCTNKCGKLNENEINYYHNRDKNACQNMEKIVEHLRVHKERPKKYTRNNGANDDSI